MKLIFTLDNKTLTQTKVDTNLRRVALIFESISNSYDVTY